MKPPGFSYFAPTTLVEALALKTKYADDSAVLAGGQSLMPLLNLRMARPEVVIDLGRVAELAGVRALGDGVATGAMTRQRDVAASELVRERAPLLPAAIRYIGHAAIRNRGTIGGSLAHADPAAELPAVALALDAVVVARSTRGERSIAAADFFLGFLTTALEADELLVEIRFPPLRGTVTATFVEVARRHGDYALAGAGVACARSSDGTVTDVRIVLLGVGAGPVRAADAEAALRGARPGAFARDEVIRLATAELEPPSNSHGSSEYRRRIAGVVLGRALEEVNL
jgi:carbon-monoxide dehydrogenase medium subunit